MIFTSDEYQALLNVPVNYDGGRNILLKLGLLPAVNGVRSFKVITEIKETLTSCLRKILIERKERSEADPHVAELPKYNKLVLLITISFLHMTLARTMFIQIYDDQAAYDFITIFNDLSVIKEFNRF